MAASTEKAALLPAYFVELARQEKTGEFEKALKTCKKILSEDPENATAFHCKIVSLINLSRFEEVVVLLNKNSKLASQLPFEKAYCEYRLNRISEALSTLKSLKEPSQREKELLAQVLYRLEKYEECYNLYRDVIKNSEDEYEGERATNLSAVVANLQATSKKNVDDDGLKDDTYELAYNKACLLLGKGDIQKAMGALRRAEELCRESFEEEGDAVDEDDVDAELALIRVQLGYTLQLLGKNEEAMKLYNVVTKQKPTDLGLAAVAANNIVSLNKDQNVFDSKKKMRTATADSLRHKLNSGQRCTIAINNCLLLLHTSQFDNCRRALKTLIDKYPSCEGTATLIEVAVCCKEKQLTNAISLLQKSCAEKNHSLTLALTLVQLCLQQGSIGKACQILQSFDELVHRSGVVSAIVTLCVHLEDWEMASKVLMDAIAWHKKNQSGSAELLSLMQEAAMFHLKMNQPRLAINTLEELRKMNPRDPRTLAQLISAYSELDPKKADAISAELPSAEELAAGVDALALELAGVTTGSRFGKKTAKTDSPRSQEQPEFMLKKRKRKKKARMPKEYDAKVDPDPERWLPRHERSTYHGRRKKEKRRDRDVGKGTQGAAAGSGNAELDGSKLTNSNSAMPASPKATPPTPSNQAGPRQQKPSAKQQKKKKKGSRW